VQDRKQAAGGTRLGARHHLSNDALPNRYADDAADEERREALRRTTYSIDGRSLLAQLP
jgi:hypothetical protein